MGNQSEEQTSRRVEEDDGWLGSKEDQEYWLSTTMPYTDIRYRPGPVRRRKSIHVEEDDLLRKEDDWLVKEDGVPTPTPTNDYKDGQDDHTKEEVCSSILVLLEEQHDDRRRIPTPDHLDGECPRNGGGTKSNEGVTPGKLCHDDGRLDQGFERVSDVEDTVNDDHVNFVGNKKDTCQVDMSTVEEETTRPGDTIMTRPPVPNSLMTTPSVDNDVHQPADVGQEDGMVTRAMRMKDMYV